MTYEEYRKELENSDCSGVITFRKSDAKEVKYTDFIFRELTDWEKEFIDKVKALRGSYAAKRAEFIMRSTEEEIVKKFFDDNTPQHFLSDNV